MNSEFEELRYISQKADRIERLAASVNFGVGILALLLGLILWRVW